MAWEEASDAVTDLRSATSAEQRAEILRKLHSMVGRRISESTKQRHFVKYTGSEPVTESAARSIAGALESMADPPSLSSLEALDRQLHDTIPVAFRR